MKCHVRYIGVVDHQNHVHAVEFKPGVNVITGRSSTGKSAMIEIFDYCFGSSDYTVPEGEITSNADLYFIVLAFPNTNLVLARKGNSNKAYIREEANEDAIASPESLQIEYFDDAFFLGLSDFKKELGRYFGLTITDVDEDLEAKKHRKDVKKPTPSVRSFTSFMLQHQNLIANKHAIFYRFDQKEKREQAIEHLKVFLGYADQNYFLISQKLNDLHAELRKVEQRLPRQAEERRTAITNVEEALRHYAAIAGKRLVTASANSMIENPARWIEELGKTSVDIDGAATEFLTQTSELNGRRSKLVAKLRKLHLQRSAVRSSIEFAGSYILEAQAIAAPEKIEITVSECPFCHTHHHLIEQEANRLHEAIEWLNGELRRSPYLRESFEADEQRLSKEISGVREEIQQIESRIAALNEQIDALDKPRPMSELAIKAKLRVENILEDVQRKFGSLLEEQAGQLKIQINEHERKLRRYQMGSRLQEASRYVETAMAEIGNRFDFESTYKPVNLKFSFESFDLWHETDTKRQVFLRAMGSGANWLYCHLSLFTALHKLFCYRGNACSIPPILFLDQPSQVYFPSIAFDNAQEFSAKDLAKVAGKSNRLDEDIRAVENLYSELVKFCRAVLEETGLEPQIIVCDHADNLDLGEDIAFESLVRARWRTRGFIDLEEDKPALT